MIKKVIIIVVVDILLFVLDIFFIEKPGPGDALGEVMFIPLLFIANLVAALLLLAFGKKETCVSLLFNAVLSPIFLLLVWQIWDDHDRDNHYQTFHFRSGGNRYQLTIEKQTNDYTIINNSIQNRSSFDDLNGHYVERKGIYYLADSGKTIVVTKDRVIGFPNALDTAKIDLDSYYW